MNLLQLQNSLVSEQMILHKEHSVSVEKMLKENSSRIHGKRIVERSPFQSIDVNGVGSLMKIGIANGRGVRKNMEIGICGEHGGDPDSIKFCHGAKLSYVSASPHRIPIANCGSSTARN